MQGLVLKGPAPVLDGLALALNSPALVLDGSAPVLDGPALDLPALLAFNLPLPKLILASFYPIDTKNIIR